MRHVGPKTHATVSAAAVIFCALMASVLVFALALPIVGFYAYGRIKTALRERAS